MKVFPLSLLVLLPSSSLSSFVCSDVKGSYREQCCGGDPEDPFDVCKMNGPPTNCKYETTVLEPDTQSDTNRENFNVMEGVNFDSIDKLDLIRKLKLENVSTEFGDKLSQFPVKPIVIGDSMFVAFSTPNKPGTNTSTTEAAQYAPYWVARFNRFTFEQYWVCKLNDVFMSYDPYRYWGGYGDSDPTYRDNYTAYWGGVMPNIQLYHTFPLSSDGEAAYFTNTKFSWGSEPDDYWIIKMDASKTGSCNVLYGTKIGSIPDRYISGRTHLVNPGYATVTRSSPNVFDDNGERLIVMPLQSSMEYFLSTHFQPATFVNRVQIDQVGAYSQVGGVSFVRDNGTDLVYQDTHLFAPERLEGFTDPSRTDHTANVLERGEDNKPIKQYVDVCVGFASSTFTLIPDYYAPIPEDCLLNQYYAFGAVTTNVTNPFEERFFPRGYVRKNITQETASSLTNDSFIGDEDCIEVSVPISKAFEVTDGSGDTADVANMDQMFVLKNYVEMYTCPVDYTTNPPTTSPPVVALTCEVPFYLHDLGDLFLDRDVTVEINDWYSSITGMTYGNIAPAYATGFDTGMGPLKILPRQVGVECQSGDGSYSGSVSFNKTFTGINPNGDTAVQANFPIGNFYTHPGGPFTYDAVSSCGPAFWVCDAGDEAPSTGSPFMQSGNSCVMRNLRIKREYVVGKLTTGTVITNSADDVVDVTGPVIGTEAPVVQTTGLMLHRQEVRKKLCRNLVEAGYKLDASEAYRLNYAGTGTWGQGIAFDAEKREVVVPTANGNWMPHHEMMNVMNSTVLRDPVDVTVFFVDGSVSEVSPPVPHQTFLVDYAGRAIFYTSQVSNIVSNHPYTNTGVTGISMKAYTFFPHGTWGVSKLDNYDPTMYDAFQIQKESYYLSCQSAFTYNVLCRDLSDEERDSSLLSLGKHWKRLNERMVSDYSSLVSSRGRQFPSSSVVGVSVDTFDMTWRTAPAELDIGWHSERWFAGELGTFYPFRQNPRGNHFVSSPDDGTTPGQDVDGWGNYPKTSPDGVFGLNTGPQIVLEDLMQRVNNLPWGADSDVSSQVTNVSGVWFAVAKQGCIYKVVNSSDVDEYGFADHTILCPMTSSDFVGNVNYGYSVAKVRDYFACTTAGCAPFQPTEHRIVYTMRNHGDVGNAFFTLNGDETGVIQEEYGTKVMVIYDVERQTFDYVSLPDTSIMRDQDGATGVNCFRADRDRFPVCYYISINGQVTFLDLGTKSIKKMQMRTASYKFPPTLIDDTLYHLPDSFDATQSFLGNIYSERAVKSNKYIDVYTMGPRGVKLSCD